MLIAGGHCAVGRNGSGKSNFFAAIRFVLHDAYTKLGQEERQALLNEGGAHHMSAYVEIVFDNSEGRFPTGKESTTLRRTVGLKKDEYSVDGRPVTKADVLNLLQSAGFSKSNPYYIVPQGRVTALTNAKDSERLALLKEVAGTRTYEEHRQESLRILEETTSKREKIRELLQFIEERMRELEEERAELGEYQAREKERRTLEYILQHRELVQVGEELAVLENENGQLAEGNAGAIEAFDALVSQISLFEGQLSTLHEQLREAEGELRLEEDLRSTHLQERSGLQLRVAELRSRAGEAQEREAVLQGQLEKIAADIVFREDALAALQPQLRAAERELHEATEHVRKLEVRQQVLQAKQGRSIQFRSAGERDKWLRKEMEALGAALQLQKKQSANLHDELETAEVRRVDLARLVESLAAARGSVASTLGDLDAEYFEQRRHRDRLVEQRKELWRAENKLGSSMAALREESDRLERSVWGGSDRGAMEGLQAVRRIATQHQIGGVFGPLYELIEVDKVYSLAAEAIAGPSLFHVVVDTDATASRLLEVMLRERSGRVTFMPLNRLSPPRSAYPSDRGEALPLLEQIRHDARFEPAVRQVFGKAIVCRDLAVGAALARQSGLTAITLSGDRVDRRGALSGGYVDRQDSKLDLMGRWKSCRDRLSEHERLLSEVRGKLQNIEPSITRAVSQMEALECRRAELRSAGGEASELECRRRELAAQTELVGVKEKSLAATRGQIALMEGQLGAMQAEVGTVLAARLSAEEQREYSELLRTIEGERRRISALSETVSSMAGNASNWESELDLSLRRQRGDLLQALGCLSLGALERDLQATREELEAVERSLEAVESSIAERRRQIEAGAAEVRNVSSALDKAREQHDKVMRAHTDRSVAMERYLTKRMALIDRRDVLQRKIRELVVAPDAPTYEAMRDESAAAILKRLHGINEELRGRFSHVNKKAHEQHASFHRQGEALRERQRELEASARAIDEFILVLDRRKDEAIERTFQQVSKGFALVFEQLVPSGRGELVMMRAGQEDEELEDDDGEEQGEGLDFVGVGIRVSFNSKSDEGLLMPQLSGGQKSLVALALIFAIQKCDPAPFYLFDEIDAALDTAHRSSVARLLASMEGQAQFLLTTFRPELLDAAQSFWGVSFGGRVSRVEQITREQALQFVEHDPLQPTATVA